jgi:acetoacetate decarboxylase
MGFVKSDAEIEAIRAVIYPTHYEYEALVVQFETEPDFLREVLPPCFEPSRSSVVAKASVSRWQSLRSGFDCAMVDLPARCGDFEGWYHLTHLISGDMPVTVGREMWGEAKKRGEMHLELDGPRGHGWGERGGVRLIEIEADLGPERAGRENPQNRLELKAFLSSDGQGLQYDPIVLKIEQNEYIDRVWEGTATLTFRGTPADPTDTIPIVRVLGAAREIGTSTMGVLEEIRLEDRERYVPYVWGRAYDIDPTHVFDDDRALSRSGSFAATRS